MRRLLLAFIAVIAVVDVGAQARRPSEYDRLLLPLHQSVAGAEGRWRVEWWLRNDGELPVDAFPLTFGYTFPKPEPDPGVWILKRPALRPNVTLSILAGDVRPSFPVPPYVPVRGSVGAFLYVQKDHDGLNVSGVVGWQSRSGNVDAQHLAAIPEASFHRGSASIHPVPIVANTRYTLRIYALPETVDSGAITIRFFEMQPQDVPRPEERLVATIVGELEPQKPSLEPCLDPCDVPDVPLAPAIYQLFDVPRPDPELQSPMRVEISPASPNVRWWAMVSVTDNATQRVRLFH
jgi:hypothetical protein